MSQALESKKQVVEEIKTKIQNCKSLVIVDYKGINVNDDTALRKKCREADVDYKVLKNRLVKIAFNDLGINDFDSYLEGTTAIAFANGDEMQAAKVITESAKDIKALETKCGMLDGKFLDKDAVEAISKIPGKEVLLAQLCGLLKSGLSGLASCLSQIAEQKAE